MIVVFRFSSSNQNSASIRLVFRRTHRVDNQIGQNPIKRNNIRLNDEITCFKPAPEVYHLAACQLGVEPGKVRLAAAHDWDVTGALRGVRSSFRSPAGPGDESLLAHSRT